MEGVYHQKVETRDNQIKRTGYEMETFLSTYNAISKKPY